MKRRRDGTWGRGLSDIRASNKKLEVERSYFVAPSLPTQDAAEVQTRQKRDLPGDAETQGVLPTNLGTHRDKLFGDSGMDTYGGIER